MQIFLAAFPILLLLILMTVFKWSGRRAGIVSWLAALLIASLFFGLTPRIFVVSQLKSLIFSLYVLAVLWPALLLYNLNAQVGGIQALTAWLSELVPDRSLLAILLAWPFSSILEGIAGFGVPIAVSAPMLVSLGISPFLAVVASAVGHTWSVTFGNMGVVFQSLVSLSGFSEAEILPYAALMMGIACLLCGLATAHVLGQNQRWKVIVLLAGIMAVVQYLVARIGLSPLASFSASVVGLVLGILFSSGKQNRAQTIVFPKVLWGTLGSYSLLTLLTMAIFIDGPLKRWLYPVLWRQPFPEVITTSGFVTPAGFGQTFRWFAHPGSITCLVIVLSWLIFSRLKLAKPGDFRTAARQTYQGAFPATIGIIATVGLSVMMDHSGMMLLLAQGLSEATGRVFPILSPIIGMLGTFATSSNTNSNVLFVSLQKQVAGLIGILPVILVASQTAGGSLGSMIAPAKLIVGCSTVGLVGKEGQVLRLTLPYGIGIGFIIGITGLVISLIG